MDEDVELRIRLLARIAAALRDEPSRDRRAALGREAVALARRSGDAAGLAYALDGLVMAIRGPDTVEECLAIGTELSEVAHRLGDKERQVAGLMHRVGPLLTLARVSEAVAHVDASARLAGELRRPHLLWDVTSSRAMMALAAGRLGDAAVLVEEAHTLARRVQPEMTLPVYEVQRFTLCDFRGALEEVEPAIHGLVAPLPGPSGLPLPARSRPCTDRKADGRRARAG